MKEYQKRKKIYTQNPKERKTTNSITSTSTKPPENNNEPVQKKSTQLWGSTYDYKN